MGRRSGFDPFGERPFRGTLRFVFFGALLLLVVIAPGAGIQQTMGESGDVYRVYDEHRVWRAVGPVLSVRYKTEHRNRALVEGEARDLLPPIAARADSAGLRYVLIRADHPIARFGHRLGLYRGWNFRYERVDQGWVPSGYW